MSNKIGRRTFLVAAAAGVAACGEGGSSGLVAPPLASPPPPTGATSPPPPISPPPPPTPTGAVSPPAALASMSSQESARFLTQATFGPKTSEIEALRKTGFSNWIKAQLSMPVSNSALTHVRQRLAEFRKINPRAGLGPAQFYEAFWRDAITAPDQLRQRMRFALSEIFVVSFAASHVDPPGMAGYYDVLGVHALGNFRNLMEAVTLNPMMGRYLTYMGNAKEDPATDASPDQNYARELMQLMTIGLVQLNQDGTPKLDSNGKTIPTYGPEDVAGLAKVFTGLSWYDPKPTDYRFRTVSPREDSRWTPMIAYPKFHSISEKRFLGVTIPASTVPDVAGDLKIALDTIFNHPNVGPFIGEQLIKRFVTSNPSPAYVARVAAVFNRNEAGIRGDLGAVIRAILLDPEARDMSSMSSPKFGKLREPILRFSHMLRGFNASSKSGRWDVGYTGSSLLLAQGPFVAPSVFNYFTPDFAPANSRTSKANLTAPEFQIVDEITVAGYANKIYSTIASGTGGGNDVRLDMTEALTRADDPEQLVNHVDYVLLNRTMSPRLRANLMEAVGSLVLPKPTTTNKAKINALKLNRARLAVYLTMVSTDFLIQR